MKWIQVGALWLSSSPIGSKSWLCYDKQSCSSKEEVNSLFVMVRHEGLFSCLHNFFFNPLHHNISMHILHTVLYTFSTVLARRICLTIKRFFSWLSFPLFPWPYCLIQGWYWKEKLDAVSFRYLSVNAIKMMLNTFCVAVSMREIVSMLPLSVQTVCIVLLYWRW